MPDETDPPRKHYGFKDREFQRDNAIATPETRTPTVQELALMANAKRAGHQAPAAPAGAPAGDPNDVHAALQRNRHAEIHSGGDELELKQPSSRRKRDYWIMLVGGNLFILVCAIATGGSLGGLAIAGAAVIIYSLSLTWIVWQLMDKY